MTQTFLTLILVLPVLIFSGRLSFSQNMPTINFRQNADHVRGIYLTANSAGSFQRRQEYVKMAQNTEINAFVIDIKDYTGRIFFDADIKLADEIGAKEIRLADISSWLAELKENGIYTIARISVFQDPFLAEKRPELALHSKKGGIWRDYKGLSWVDPTLEEVWRYNLDLAKEAVRVGFDEVNFDYIRFPSDGNIKDIEFGHLAGREKHEVMKDFFRYLSASLQYYPVVTSADLFGMVLWRDDGLNIGQRLEDAVPFFDYICPMIYPSHFPKGFMNFDFPAQKPYEIVYESLSRSQSKIANFRAKLRPWLQDFNLGAQYTPDMIRKQKKATYDAGVNGWIFWNAANRYTIDGFDKN